MARLPPRPLVALLLIAAFTLGLGLALKDSCNGPGWDGYQYRALCYNDIVPLYYAHGFADDLFPYADHPERDASRPKDGYDPDKPDTHWGFVEYPVLTGLHMWFAARLGTAWTNVFAGREDGSTFLYTNAVLLSAFALATVVLLWRMVDEPRRVLYFAAGTPLLFYAFHNWDLMAVFFMVLTLYLFERSDHFWSGVALSLGASAKLFPIVMAPFLFIVLWRRAYEPPGVAARVPRVLWAALVRSRAAWALFLGTVLGYLVVNLPFVLFASSEIYFAVFEFHLRRSPNFETLWWVLKEYGLEWRHDWLARFEDREHVDAFLLPAFLGAATASLVLAWRRRWGAREAAFAAVLLFLILNKIFSVQYALWVLPFFALLPLPAWSFALFVAADAWVYSTIFGLFTSFNTDRFESARAWLSLAVIARTAALVTLLALVVSGVAKRVRKNATRRPETYPTGSASNQPGLDHVGG